MKFSDLFQDKQEQSYSDGNSIIARNSNSRDLMPEKSAESGFSTKPDNVNMRDKISFATLAMGSPLFLFGLGTAFALIDEYNILQTRSNSMNFSNYANRSRFMPLQSCLDSTTLSMDLNQNRHHIFNSQYIDSKFDKANFNSQKLNLGRRRQHMQRFDQSQVTFSNLDSINKSDISTGEERSTTRFYLEDKNWLNAGKLLNTKMLLVGQVEQLNQQMEFSQVTALIAQIEVLDKMLKRLGC